MTVWTQPSLLDLLNPEPETPKKPVWLRKFGEHHVYYDQTPDGPHGWIKNRCSQCAEDIPIKRGWHWSGPGHVCMSYAMKISRLIDPDTESENLTEMKAIHFPMEWDGMLFVCKCGDKLGHEALKRHVQSLPDTLPDSYWALVGRRPKLLEES